MKMKITAGAGSDEEVESILVWEGLQ